MLPGLGFLDPVVACLLGRCILLRSFYLSFVIRGWRTLFEDALWALLSYDRKLCRELVLVAKKLHHGRVCEEAFVLFLCPCGSV